MPLKVTPNLMLFSESSHRRDTFIKPSPLPLPSMLTTLKTNELNYASLRLILHWHLYQIKSKLIELAFFVYSTSLFFIQPSTTLFPLKRIFNQSPSRSISSTSSPFNKYIFVGRLGDVYKIILVFVSRNVL